MSLKSYLITYLIGGLTLPPLVVLGALYLLFVLLPKYIDGDDDLEDKDDDLSDFETLEYKTLKMTELQESQTSGVKAYKAGWITVTREYHTFVNNANDKQLENKETESKSAYTALYRLVKNNKKPNQSNDVVDTSTTNGSVAANSPNGSSANVNTKKAVRRKNRYFGVLRHGNLFLYKDEVQKDVQHVIVLSNNIVTLWPRDLRDGELFTKRSAICILKRQPRRSSDLPPKESSASLHNASDVESTMDMLKTGHIPPKSMGFFIYCDTNYEKEDWYFELIKATKRDNFQPTGTDLDLLEPSIYANALHFKTSDMMNLIQTLHSSEGQLQSRWLNAVVGRIFLSLQFTEFFENIVREKLLKKLAKINKPGFLDEIKVKKIDVGNSAPFISFPHLDSLNPDGSLQLSMKFSYTGKLSLQVATKANINLGSHFKTREVNILLAVTLNKIEGPLLVRVKSPPSTRIWYTFESMPTLDMTIEPVVSQRQITYGMITKVIENKFRDGIKDSLVQPHWDDITFFDTSNEVYRAGIWDTTKRPDNNDTHIVSEAEEEEILGDNGALGEENDVFEESSNSDSAPKSSGFDSRSPPSDDVNSIRSRTTTQDTLRSRSSFTGSVSSSKKTTPSIVTSSEQFLADGTYVSKESSATASPVKEAFNNSQETLSSSSTLDKEKLFSRSSTMQLLSEEATAGKKTISNSIKKLGKWYDKNRNGSSATIKSSEQDKLSPKPYTPPEMIQSRRRTHSSTSESPRVPKRSVSNNTLNSQDSGANGIKAAPQAHTFPAEYLYGLQSKAPDSEADVKQMLPSKIPDMKSPYEITSSPSASPPKESSPTSPAKTHFPRRKPVEEDLAAQQHSIPPPLPDRENTTAAAIPEDTTAIHVEREETPGSTESSTGTSIFAPPPLPEREVKVTEVSEVPTKPVPEDKESVSKSETNGIESSSEVPSKVVTDHGYETDLKRAIEESLKDETPSKDV